MKMRRLNTTLGAGVLLLTVAACAGQPSDVGFGGQPPAPPGPPPPAKPIQERAVVPDSSLDTSALPKGYPKRVWTQDGGTVVVATGQEGGCSKVHGELAEQSPQLVKVVFVEASPEKPRMCTMDLRYPPVTVQLSAPLGPRKIVLEEHQVKVPDK